MGSDQDNNSGQDAMRNPQDQPVRPEATAGQTSETMMPSPETPLAPRPAAPPTDAAGDWNVASEELERQAREAVRLIREQAGELGARVRRAMEHAQKVWDESGGAAAASAAPAGGEAPAERSALAPETGARARALARRWVGRDFLVEPDLPDAMQPVAVRDIGVWLLELRERGESRVLSETSEPYMGTTPPPPGPVLPVWEYDFATPDIESGERHERLDATAVVGACLKCHGSGHTACAACEGKGFVRCPECHGRGRRTCRTCHGRGRVADAAAERRARASKSYWQVRAERLAVDAAGRLADLSERLRQEYGVPLPPSGEWAPTAPASGETVPCPDCTDGTIACTCNGGKLVCETCKGSTYAPCAACSGTGRVLRLREVVRRFDTRIAERRLPLAASDAEAGEWLTDQMLHRAAGTIVWEGSDALPDGPAPADMPEEVWSAARAMATEAARALPVPATEGVQEAPRAERRVIGRTTRLVRVPVVRVAYTYDERPYAVVAVGRSGAERFWADEFPPRWARIGRFVRALARDLGDLGDLAGSGGGAGKLPGRGTPGQLSTLEDYRARRAANGSAQHVRIELAPEGQGGETGDGGDGEKA